ncbi:hypothetical protein COCON_G00092790 [Conger conger]|uniref:Uncharacterized protein n=1 Tax=Conger conger TaxID=82655 RepID=A0A9Q1HZ88_CONCO|nr:hypothetical protein COCON_G00092790 [Conger conger]
MEWQKQREEKAAGVNQRAPGWAEVRPCSTDRRILQSRKPTAFATAVPDGRNEEQSLLWVGPPHEQGGDGNGRGGQDGAAALS